MYFLFKVPYNFHLHIKKIIATYQTALNHFKKFAKLQYDSDELHLEEQIKLICMLYFEISSSICIKNKFVLEEFFRILGDSMDSCVI